MLKLNHNHRLSTPKDIALKVPASASGSPRLRHVSMIKAKVNGTLYIIWPDTPTGDYLLWDSGDYILFDDGTRIML